MSTCSRIVQLLILTAAMLCMACENSFDQEISKNSANFSLGYKNVQALAKHCELESDFAGEDIYSGDYQLKPEKPSYFPYPRFNNPIVEALNWGNNFNPAATYLTLINNEGALEVHWKIQQDEVLEGNLYEENETRRLCFHGPITIDFEAQEVQAYLYADGTLPKDGSSIQLELNIGISAMDEKKIMAHLGLKETMRGQKSDKSDIEE